MYQEFLTLSLDITSSCCDWCYLLTGNHHAVVDSVLCLHFASGLCAVVDCQFCGVYHTAVNVILSLHCVSGVCCIHLDVGDSILCHWYFSGFSYICDAVVDPMLYLPYISELYGICLHYCFMTVVSIILTLWSMMWWWWWKWYAGLLGKKLKSHSCLHFFFLFFFFF